MKVSWPRFLLHVEGLAVLIVACVAYQKLGASWLKFAVLFLAPDLSMFGYLAGLKTGAAAYNAFHTYLVPVILGAVFYFTQNVALIPLCLIWVAHIGFDRLLGYGLKYATAFKDTHLSRV